MTREENLAESQAQTGTSASPGAARPSATNLQESANLTEANHPNQVLVGDTCVDGNQPTIAPQSEDDFFRLQESDDDGLLLFKPNPKALAELAMSTCFVIATLLVIPDCFALLPNSATAVSWGLKVLGDWLSAAVIWFVSFLCILHFVRVLVNGIEISNQGIKMWRFAKLIPWSEVDSIGVDQQVFFSKIFRLPLVARRLTVFERKKARKGFRLVPQYLPSFYFSNKEFLQLCMSVCERRFKFRPDSIDVFISGNPGLPGLKSTSSSLGWQRIALSAVIALGLTFFLSRKAQLLYAYNSGNKAMAEGEVREAEKLYTWATKSDPTFAAAWWALARAEYNLGHIDSAKQCWQHALILKPDFVEPKISLAHLAIQQQQYDVAKKYIDSALMINPLNPDALVTRAEIEMHTGDILAAMEDARIVMTQRPDLLGPVWVQAACTLAQAKLRMGEPQQAQDALHQIPAIDAGPKHLDYMTAKRLIVSGETALALEQYDKARKDFTRTLTLPILYGGDKVEALLGLSQVELAEQQFEAARANALQAQKGNPDNPWPLLLLAQVAMNEKNDQLAQQLLKASVAKPGQDTVALVEAGNLFRQYKQFDQARICAQRALVINPHYKAAKDLLAATAH